METTALNDIADKFESVLNGLLKKNYNVTNDVYFDMFITHLSDKSNEDSASLQTRPFVFTWIERSVEKIISDSNKDVQAFVFTCRLLALLTENAENFQKLIEQKIYEKVKYSVENVKELLQNPSVKLANITLYLSMLKHSDGIAWLKQEMAWKRAIEYCIEDQTIYVVRKANDFITKFLFQIVADHEEDLSMKIITEIIRPLEENVYVEQIGNVCVDSSDLQYKALPSVNIMCNILDRYIQLGKKSSIAHTLIRTCKGLRNIWKLTDMTHDPKFFEKIMSCLVYINFALLVDKLNKDDGEDSTMISIIDFNDFGLKFLNGFKLCVLKNQQLALLSAARQYYVLWKGLGDRVPEEILLGNQLTKFENQVILFQILPLINMMHRHPSCLTELHEEYVMKLFNISTEHTLRICYSFRDSLQKGIQDLPDISCKAIQSILSMEHVLHRDRAIIVFQALCHIIKGIAFDTQPDDVSSLIERPTFLTSIIAGLHTIVKKYRITWKDSYESISLMNSMLALIEQTNLPPRLAVDVLKLTQLSVEHFLAPNLALLVDTMTGSDMQKLGPVILKRMHDNNWEVRDSTLELLSSIANISMLKFPAFQQHILINGLCPVVVQIAQNDTEPYVRASALSCLCQMVPVNLFWEQCLTSMDLIPYLIKILQTECEGVVRKEAVTLIASIYENQKVATTQLNSIYAALAYSSVNDLYWEVKVKALDCWHSVIKRELQYQGVIDGTFPSVTFSKEKKKIVTLTPKEITLRLTKILDELASRGCLGVLLACLKDEDDLLVVKASIHVIKCLSEFLDKYNYWEEFQKCEQAQIDANRQSPVSMQTDSIISNNTNKITSNSAAEENIRNDSSRSDEVIQSIVSAQDINLLSMAYENQMNVVTRSNEDDIDNADYVKRYSKITAHKFLKSIKSIDLDDLIKSKTEWLAQTDSFSSLLNDMLDSMQVNDANDADCY